jgi:hypothetical protein
MAQILHVIPHSLYEQIVDLEIFKNAFREDQPTRINQVLDKLPVTLREIGRPVLHKLTDSQSVMWNDAGEIQFERKWIAGSNISELLNQFTLQSPNFHKLPGAKELIKVLDDHRTDSSSYKIPPTTYDSKQDHTTDPKINCGSISNESLEEDTAIWINFENQFGFK